MPVSPSSTQIVNKDYVDTAIAAIPSGAFDLFDFKWRDSTTSNTSWALSDGNWKTNATAYQHLVDDLDDVNTLHLYEWHNADNSLFIYLTTAISTETHSTDPVYDENGVQIGTLFGYTATQVVYNGVYYSCDDSVGQDIKEAQADTVAGTTVVYYRAADGHKIVLVDNKTDVDAVYADVGVAWYYILDINNQRFMLPRTQFGFTGVRNNVGDYVEAGLPNMKFTTSWILINDNTASTGAATTTQNSSTGVQGSGNTSKGRTLNVDASRSSSIYGNSTTVQPPATEMYLYFYVGA